MQSGADEETPVPRSAWGHRLMFLVLIAFAFVAYAPTVLLPVLREHAQILAEERRLRGAVDELETEAARRERLVQAFKHDPVVNERLAQLDLRYERPGEEVIPVAPQRGPREPAGQAAAAYDPELPLADADWPAWTHDTERWARRWGLIRVYSDPSIRVVLLLMAGGLVIAAFVLYPPQARRSESST